MARRFGSIRQLSSGRSQALYEHRLLGGRQASSTFDTRAEAEDWLSKEARRFDSGDWRNPTDSQMRLSGYFAAWLSGRTLAPRTRELYDGLWTRYIGPRLGGVRFAELTPRAVRLWHSGLVMAPRPGAVTVAKAYRLLNTVSGDAVRDGLLVKSPCTIRGAGVERSPEMRTVSPAQVAGLVDACPVHLRAMVMTAAYTGLRWGELTGLSVGAFDPQHGTIRVERALIEMTSGQMSFGPPKTASSRRLIHVSRSVVDVLAWHADMMNKCDRGELMFTTPFGRPLRRSGFTLPWRTATVGAGVAPLRFHDLRHSAATLATSNGATLREVQAWLGHSTPSAALRYQHVGEARAELLADRLDALVVRPTLVGRSEGLTRQGASAS